jgi:hypothetical protein
MNPIANPLGARRGLGVAAALLLAGTGLPALAQDDLRDVVSLTNGQVLRGRVLDRHDPQALLLLQGNQRVRVEHTRVAGLDTVRDRLREFFVHHDRLPGNQRYQWFLVGWAQQRGLDAIARLQALSVVLENPDHEEARAFLGHRRRGKEWVWPKGDQWVRFQDLEQNHAEWGRAWQLEGEHFAVRCNAKLQRVVDTLFDLERLYIYWFDAFGDELRLREALGKKLQVQIWAERGQFPVLAGTGHPYFRPRVEVNNTLDPSGSTGLEPSNSATYFDGPQAGRATRLFEVATQHLMYRTLADDPAFPTPKERLCAWAEVGLGQYVDRMMQGPPGRARPVVWPFPLEEGQLVLSERRYGLPILTHRQARQYFLTVASNTALDWASAHLFVAYLLDTKNDPTLRPVFLGYLIEAMARGRAESSSTFDRLLGRKIETLEAPWRQWVDGNVRRLTTQPPGR